MCAPMIKAKYKTLSDRLSTVYVDFARLPDTAWARQAGRAVFITPSIVTLLNRPLLLPVCLSLSLSLSVTASLCVSHCPSLRHCTSVTGCCFLASGLREQCHIVSPHSRVRHCKAWSALATYSVSSDSVLQSRIALRLVLVLSLLIRLRKCSLGVSAKVHVGPYFDKNKSRSLLKRQSRFPITDENLGHVVIARY